MPCALTQGFTLDCRDSVGGIEQILIGELSEKASSTVVAGVITALAMNSTKQFFIYEVDKEDAEAVETEQLSVENGTLFYEQVVNFTIKKLSVAARNEIRLLAQNRVMIIIKDNNGVYWMYGFERGADKVGTNEAKTGKAYGDLNGYTLAFMGKEVAPAYEVDSSLIASLTTPAP